MSKVFVITKREFLKYIRSKWFRVFFFLPFLGMGILSLLSYIVPEGGAGAREKIKKIAVIDYSGRLMQYLENTENYQFVEMDSLQATDKVMTGDIEGFLVIPGDSEIYNPRYYSLTILLETYKLRGPLNTAILKLKLEDRGVDVSLADELNRRVNLTSRKITETGKKGGEELIILGFVMVIFLYMFILLASQLMARSAVEEKLNGMIELIISDISPPKLLLGKLIGVTASVLLLVAVWLLIGITFIGNAVFFINRTIDISLPLGVIFYFVFAFIFGYVLYTSFILLFVSTVTSEQEVNQAMSVGVMLILIPYFMAITLVKDNPGSIVSVISSQIPFFTPLIMPLRLSISNVPMWEIILSIIILTLSAWGILMLAGKIYRVSMLMVGKPLRLKEVFRLIKMK